jgi:hypothetical protein
MGKLAVLLILKLEGSDLSSVVYKLLITQLLWQAGTLELVPQQFFYDRRIMALQAGRKVTEMHEPVG